MMTQRTLIRLAVLGAILACGLVMTVFPVSTPTPMPEPETALRLPMPHGPAVPSDPSPSGPPGPGDGVPSHVSPPPEPVVLESVADYNALSAYGPLPDHLSDVGFDGALTVDAGGRLIVDRDTRRLFDFFLAAVRLEGPDLCAARIEEYIDLTLPPEAKDQARQVWQAYRAYREGLRALHRESGDQQGGLLTVADRVKQRIEQRRDLRRRCMPPDMIRAFFETEEQDEDRIMSRTAHATADALSETSPAPPHGQEET
ncbi:hypothetical protein JCM14469_33690 [Desulfatiferula olefinivorans]